MAEDKIIRAERVANAVAAVVRVASKHGKQLKTKLRYAMFAVRVHLLDEETQFRAAIAGVMLYYEEGSIEYERLKQQTTNMCYWDRTFTSSEEREDDMKPIVVRGRTYKAIDLMEIWKSVRDSWPTKRHVSFL